MHPITTIEEFERQARAHKALRASAIEMKAGVETRVAQFRLDLETSLVPQLAKKKELADEKLEALQEFAKGHPPVEVSDTLKAVYDSLSEPWP